jgi:hypothetical protein
MDYEEVVRAYDDLERSFRLDLGRENAEIYRKRWRIFGYAVLAITGFLDAVPKDLRDRMTQWNAEGPYSRFTSGPK